MVSIAGTQMQSAAILWHVSELSSLPIALGIVGLVRILPVLSFSLVAGVAADAFNRRRVLLLTQSSLAALALFLGVLTNRGMDRLWVVYAITAASAAVASFDLPARQALVPNLVPPEDLANAFSLNAIAFQVGAILGPALGGLVLAQLGLAYAYILNAVSYLAVIAALLLMGPVIQARMNGPSSSTGAPRPASQLLDSVREGMRFVRHQPIILSSMLLDFFATFFSSAMFLLPIFAKQILHVGVVGYGWLVAAPAIGAGSVAGAIAFFRRPIRRQGRVLLSAVAAFGLATVVFGLSRDFWLTLAALILTGAADGTSTIIRNTLRQLQTPDYLRGRMTSVNQIFFMGGPQLGELEAGLVAQWLGAPFSVVTGGIGCLLAAALIAARFPQLGRYDGIEASATVQAAAG
jgi:MFS family permease